MRLAQECKMGCDCINMERLAVCVIDNGSAPQRSRTLESLKRQTESSFSYKVLDCTAFWSVGRNMLNSSADYVMFLYSGSQLEENAVETIYNAIEDTGAPWFYFDEKRYSAENGIDAYGVLEKPDFDSFGFAQKVYTGEGVVFSQEILKGMDLKYRGSNFAVALWEMTIAAAAKADAVHIRECLLTRHNKCKLFPDEENLLADALKRYLEERERQLLGIKRSDGFGLHLHPVAETPMQVSIILLAESVSAASKLDFSHLGEGVEVICQTEAMPYWKKCMLGAQKASNEMLCFLDAGCVPPSKEGFHTLLRYASLPNAGMVSPCLYKQDSVIYAGTFLQMGKLFRWKKTEENMKCSGRDILSVRQTAVPAWQFWMVTKQTLFQGAVCLEKLQRIKELPKEHMIMECAYQIRSMGRQNLYVGNVLVNCERDDTASVSRGISDALFQRKDAFFLDLYCPTALRSIMRKNELKGVKAYFPKQMPSRTYSSPKVFVLSHELSLTGAPIVLAHAVRILKEEGWQIVVASPVDGPLKQEFLRENIPVLIMGNMDENIDWLRCASDFDLVLVNTVVPFRQIEQLRNCSIPVMWWLHDAKSGYESYLRHVLPETVSDNIHTFSVSKYADDALKQYRPKYKTDLLLYGLKDEAPRINSAAHPIQGTNGRKVFVSVGTVIHRKGQDILAQAVRLLPDAVRDQCLFLFIGRCIDLDIFQQVIGLEKDYPEAVRQIDAIPHDDIFNLYKQAAAVICSSRDDPLPTFMAETMMVSGVCICSENTGTAAVIENGYNGYIYRNDDPTELAECICHVVECKDLDALRKGSRKTFEDVFSMDIFREKLLSSVAQCLTQKGGVTGHE